MKNKKKKKNKKKSKKQLKLVGKNAYKLYLNVFRHLTGVLLKNYGIFFNSEDLEEEVVL